MSGTLAGLSSQSSQPQRHAMTVSPLNKSYEACPCSDAIVDDAERARRHIDQEMQRLEGSIRILKSRRNLFAPISRLPPEMLAKIFTFCVSELSDNNKPLAWIKVSHISRYWRAVALDCPSLWGNIVFSRPKWAEEMLKRSKMASLIIRADLTCMTPKMCEAVQLALRHISRTRELQVIASSATIEKLLAELPSSAPMLQSLSLANPRHNGFGLDDGCSIPESFLGGDTSRLRRLELVRCNLSWDSSLLVSLTRLKIHDISPVFRPTINQLIDTLRKMPTLEHLDLQESLPATYGDAIFTQFSDKVVSLPRLSYLSITSSVTECANLLKRITIPSTATIHLNCKGTESTDNDFSSILTIFTNPRSSYGKPIRNLYMQYIAPVSLVVQGWSCTSYSGELLRRTSPNVELHLSWRRHGMTKLETVMKTICKALPLAQLTTLRLSHLIGIETKTWVSAFGGLPKLRSVHIRGDSAHSFIAAIREEPLVTHKQITSGGIPNLLTAGRPGSRRKGSTVPTICFPNLVSLTLEDTAFDNRFSYSHHLEDLRDCLMERYERRGEVRELYLYECSHITEGDIDMLKEIVVDVHWDGIEQGFTDDDEDVEGDYESLDPYGYGFFMGYDLSDGD